VALAPELRAVVAPLLAVLAPLNQALGRIERQLIRGVRASRPAQVTAYVGLVPREYGSGEHNPRGPGPERRRCQHQNPRERLVPRTKRNA
jgi:transposase